MNEYSLAKVQYYNPEEAALHAFEEFGGERGLISARDLIVKEFRFALVLDPAQVETIRKPNPNWRNEFSHTDMMDRKGCWYYGLCPVMSNGKWGLIDPQANLILPFIFDEEPLIGFMSYPGPGPVMPEKLRIMYKQGDNIGYYLIKGNYQVEHEAVHTREEWTEREMWT